MTQWSGYIPAPRWRSDLQPPIPKCASVSPAQLGFWNKSCQRRSMDGVQDPPQGSRRSPRRGGHEEPDSRRRWYRPGRHYCLPCCLDHRASWSRPLTDVGIDFWRPTEAQRHSADLKPFTSFRVTPGATASAAFAADGRVKGRSMPSGTGGIGDGGWMMSTMCESTRGRTGAPGRRSPKRKQPHCRKRSLVKHHKSSTVLPPCLAVVGTASRALCRFACSFPSQPVGESPPGQRLTSLGPWAGGRRTREAACLRPPPVAPAMSCSISLLPAMLPCFLWPGPRHVVGAVSAGSDAAPLGLARAHWCGQQRVGLAYPRLELGCRVGPGSARLRSPCLVPPQWNGERVGLSGPSPPRWCRPAWPRGGLRRPCRLPPDWRTTTCLR